ncbi:MAG TPA: chemotaxis protein CheW [Mycobacteriales bacterium]|nr:chemotaxis protein CheW [Mycobacteriales bacterium]
MSDLSPAAATPAPARTGADEGVVADSDAVVVRLGAGRFAIDLAHVAEVGRVPRLTRVPGVPGWVAGVANWRGRILPALDLRELLGAPAGPWGSTARLVVLTVESLSVGVVVDAVDGTTTVGADVAAFPAELGGLGADLIQGQLPRTDGPVAVLDATAVVALRTALPQGRRSA